MPTNLHLHAPDNGGYGYQLTVPTQWADVSMAQFVQLFGTPGQPLSPAEILCALPAGSLERLSVQAVTTLGTLLAFAQDAGPVLELLPTLGLPDVGSLSYGSLLLVQQRIAAEPELPAVAHMAYVLAIYRMELLWGKYDATRVAACEAALLAAPCTEVYPDASAFLSSWSNWQKGTNPTSPTTASPAPKRKRRAAKSWASASGAFFRWMRRLAAPS